MFSSSHSHDIIKAKKLIDDQKHDLRYLAPENKSDRIMIRVVWIVFFLSAIVTKLLMNYFNVS